MIRLLLIVAICLVLSGCASAPAVEPPIDQKRIDIAERLLQKGQFAASLQQWRILALANPENTQLRSKINTIENMVSTRKNNLLSQIGTQSNSADEKTLLKVLALDPNDLAIKEQLRKLSWERELANVHKKTYSLAKSFKENNKQAEAQIRLARQLEKIEEAIADRKYALVISYTEELRNLSPNNDNIKMFLLAAHLGMAEMHRQEKAYLSALQHMDEAQQYADKNTRQEILKEATELRSDRARHYILSSQKIFNRDIDRAIEYLKLALRFEKASLTARRLLAKAIRIRKNLQRIKDS